MRRAVLAVLAVGAVMTTPALAVGLGPLSRSGVTDGPVKAFWLTISNPHTAPRSFVAYATEPGEDAQGLADIDILPAHLRIAAGGQRRVLVIARDLTPGSTRKFRVCAELAQQEGMIHARVCSQISARRIAPRG